MARDGRVMTIATQTLAESLPEEDLEMFGLAARPPSPDAATRAVLKLRGAFQMRDILSNSGRRTERAVGTAQVLSDDAAGALPARAVHVVIEHPAAPLPPAPTLGLKTDRDYQRWAEDHRRSQKTTVRF